MNDTLSKIEKRTAYTLLLPAVFLVFAIVLFPIFAPPRIAQWEPTNTLLPIVISLTDLFFFIPIHFLCESATFIETKDAMSQLFPIVTFASLALISEKPPI